MDKQVFIIAEAGVNHNGSLDLALKMVDAAAEAGADAVKFQTFTAESLVSRHAPKADYQVQTTGNGESQFEMLKALELSREAQKRLYEYCSKRHIIFMSSPFDLDSIDFLNDLGLEIFKIPSGEITNLPYLRRIGSLQKKVILSTGMADMGEIKAALDVLVSAGTPLEQITVLHCNTEYPSPFQDVNLKAMQTIAETFGVKGGYSDHTEGVEVPVAAVALGARVIEKHFTLDKEMEGPDHKASLDPIELQHMVQAIRNIEEALGNGIKKPSQSEIKNQNIIRKSIVAAKQIKAGELFTEKNLTVKRPGSGIDPMLWDEVIGKKAISNFGPDEEITV